jgi:hypothetical protein
MSSIVIAGDTSGSVTLQAPAVSGSTVLNLPSTSGTIQTSGAGYTTNGVAYATNATGLVTGSALVFDGTNLGIGTSSPSFPLHVQTNASGYALTLKGRNAGGNENWLQWTNFAGTTQAGMYATSDNLVFATSSSYTEGMRLTSTGLGIGTSSPVVKLDVYGSGAYLAQFIRSTSGVAGGGITIGNQSRTCTMFTDSAGWSVYDNTAAAQRMLLDSAGNLGLGVSPSIYWGGNRGLDVGSPGCGLTSRQNNEINLCQNAAFNVYATTGAAAIFGIGNNGQFAWNQAASGTAGSTITFTTRMLLDTSGNLCIGRTSVYSTNAERLSVQATGNSPAILAINAAGATDYTYVSWNSATTGDNKFVGFFTEASPTLRGSIDYNRAGGVTRYNTSSDATLKNINGDAPKQISINILNSTKIREYSWKDDATNKVQIGVIAQELHETFKGAVSVGGDKVTTDAEGNETTEYVPWAVDKTAFTFHLVAGWQEHERIIQEQQALITTLTDRISVLENK